MSDSQRPGTTRREDAAKPPARAATRREGSAPPSAGPSVTRREGDSARQRPQPKVTRRESDRGARPPSGVTRRETQQPRPARPRRNLPATVPDHYEWVRDLDADAAGQAMLQVCRDRRSGREVIVKVYNPGARLDEDAMAKIHDEGTDRRHVVDVIDFDADPNDAWEILEYCRRGSLGTYAEQYGLPFDIKAITAVVDEMASALEYVHHSLGIAHRDVKPENILVRVPLPQLDLVLTDFGVAASQMVSVDARSFAGTTEWAAPETRAGSASSKPGDWWALGLIVHWLATGRREFTDETGRALSREQADLLRLNGADLTGDIASERVRLLVDGLLVWDYHHRWRGAEVKEWLAGGSPEVWRGPVVAQGPGQAPRRVDVGFTFAGTVVSSGAELAQAIRDNWEAAGGLIEGRVDAELERFLGRLPEGADAKPLLTSGTSTGATLVRLQGVLDPEHVVEFRGQPLTDVTLTAQIERADRGDQSALEWLDQVRRERILAALASITRSDAAARMDANLTTWYGRAEEVWRRLPSDVASAARQDALALLPTAMEESAAAEHAGGRLITHAAILVKGYRGEVDWANALAAEVRATGSSDVGLCLAAVPALTWENQRVADAAREERARKRAAFVAQRSRQLGKSAWHRVLFLLIVTVFLSLTLGSMEVGTFTWPTIEGLLLLMLPGLIAIGVTLGVEWVAGLQQARLRTAMLWLGMLAGSGPFLELMFQGDARGPVYVPWDELAWWPVVTAVFWELGNLASVGIERLAEGQPENASVARRMKIATRFSWALAAIPLATGIVAFVYDHARAMDLNPSALLDSGPAWLQDTYGAFVDAIPIVDPLGLSDNLPVAAALGAVVFLLQCGSRDLARIRPWLGAAALIAVAVLALIALFAMPWALGMALVGAGFGGFGVLVVVVVIAIIGGIIALASSN